MEHEHEREARHPREEAPERVQYRVEESELLRVRQGQAAESQGRSQQEEGPKDDYHAGDELFHVLSLFPVDCYGVLGLGPDREPRPRLRKNELQRVGNPSQADPPVVPRQHHLEQEEDRGEGEDYPGDDVDRKVLSGEDHYPPDASQLEPGDREQGPLQEYHPVKYPERPLVPDDLRPPLGCHCYPTLAYLSLPRASIMCTVQAPHMSNDLIT